MATIEIKGLDKLERKLGAIRPALARGIKASTLHIKGQIAKYPPATSGNAPKQYTKGQWNTWYERGWGQKWALSKGGWHGKKVSEMLGRKWTIKVVNKGMTGIVGNNVSYGPYVQDTERQAAPMKRIGWKTTGEVAEAELPRVMNFIQGEIEKELKK